LRRIEKIKRLEAELNPMRLLGRELFEAGKVPGFLRRCVEQRNTGIAIALRPDVNAFAGAA
jgi:hypothetical protein